MKTDRDKIILRLHGAQEAFLEKDYRTSLSQYKWLENHLQDEPENLPFIWIEIGWNHYFLKDFRNAIFYLRKALDSRQINSRQIFDCLRLLGYCYEYTGNPDRALAYLQDALQQSVEDPIKRHVHFEIGKIFFAQNNALAAKPYLEKAYKFFDDDEASYCQTIRYYLGFIAYIESQPLKAKAFFNEMIENSIDPGGKAPGFFGLAHLAYEAKQYQEVLEACLQIVDFDPDFYDKETLAFFLCRSYMELKKWKELEVFLPQLLENYPDGKYKSAYPTLVAALRTRTVLPGQENIDLSRLN